MKQKDVNVGGVVKYAIGKNKLNPCLPVNVPPPLFRERAGTKNFRENRENFGTRPRILERRINK